MDQGALSPQLRDDAAGRLNVLWEEGRLSPGDHERRITQVRRARSRADLDAAMADLPVLGGATGPVLIGSANRSDGAAAGGTPLEPTSVEAGDGPPLDRDDDGRTDGLVKLPRNTAGAIMALTPLIAFVLFVTTGSWVWFLAIPIVAGVLFGSSGGHSHHHGRAQRRRDRRR